MGEKSVRLSVCVLMGIAVLLFALAGVVNLNRLSAIRQNYGINVASTAANSTTSLGAWQGSIPRSRKVVEVSEFATSADYAGAIAGFNGEQNGGYRWEHGDIGIAGDAQSWVLVHEYGHALTVDAIAQYETSGDYGKAARIAQIGVGEFKQESPISDAPDCLAVVAREYQCVPRVSTPVENCTHIAARKLDTA